MLLARPIYCSPSAPALSSSTTLIHPAPRPSTNSAFSIIRQTFHYIRQGFAFASRSLTYVSHSLALGLKTVARPLTIQQVRQRISMFRVPVRWLESVVKIPFVRVRLGLTTVIGLVPFLGVAVSAGFALYPIILASQVPDLPQDVLPKMIGNMFLGAGLGLIPFVGGLIANFYRPTWRNLR
ncbi:hypothetical protein HKX48_005347 [Thoreauomyces humboldtii]|nr:hypothetical protein HKX48_005347 [Thoreauomyces humboldtii]